MLLTGRPVLALVCGFRKALLELKISLKDFGAFAGVFHSFQGESVLVFGFRFHISLPQIQIQEYHKERLLLVILFCTILCL